MALEEQLEGTRITRKGDPSSLYPHLKWWLQEDNVLEGQPLHQLNMLFDCYGCIKKGGVLTWENTLQGEPWSSYTLNYLELRWSFGPLRIPRHLVLSVSPGSNSTDALVSWFCDNSPQSVYKLAKSCSRANTASHLTCHYLLMDPATVILCYELSGQEALTLHQVKAHVVRAPCCF